MQNNPSIVSLVLRSLSEELNAEDQLVLDQWLNENPKRRAWYENAEATTADDMTLRSAAALEELGEDIHERVRVGTGIQSRLNRRENTSNNPVVVPPAHRVHFLRRGWFKYAAAIIILFGIGAYFYTQKQKPAIVATTKTVPVQHDVLPGGDKAILTLSDGKQVELNSATSETIQDQTLSIENKNGHLIYKKGELVAMNTMMIPKGGQYQLTLADGTKVWLNAASSINYPTIFTGNKREVYITGEAYFEVAKNPQQPFLVKTSKEEITVLGTEFNVHVYDGEPLKTSLIEGSVKIDDRVLQPGQAFINGKIVATNIEQDIAWKNGYFSFENKSLEQIMTELARWYDLQVSYQGTLPRQEFVGEVGRNLNLSQVLKVLEKLGVKFKMENNRRVVIMP